MCGTDSKIISSSSSIQPSQPTVYRRGSKRGFSDLDHEANKSIHILEYTSNYNVLYVRLPYYGPVGIKLDDVDAANQFLMFLMAQNGLK